MLYVHASHDNHKDVESDIAHGMIPAPFVSDASPLVSDARQLGPWKKLFCCPLAGKVGLLVGKLIFLNLLKLFKFGKKKEEEKRRRKFLKFKNPKKKKKIWKNQTPIWILYVLNFFLKKPKLNHAFDKGQSLEAEGNINFYFLASCDRVPSECIRKKLVKSFNCSYPFAKDFMCII